MATIIISDADGGKHEVDRNLFVSQSVTLKNVLQDTDVGDDDVAEIPLSNISTTTFNLIHTYLQHQRDYPPTDTESRSLTLTDWENGFLQVLSNEQLFALMLAANYLDIKSLLEITCKFTASIIKAKTPAELRSFYGVNREFTKEEIAATMAANPWLNTE